MNKKFKNSEIGFTLIEMLGAVLIVVILSGVLIASNRGAVTQAVDTKVKAFATSIPITLSGSYIANWKLDQIIGSSVPYTTPDSYGANTGILGDGTTSSTFPTQLSESSCVFGKCFSFDGADYVNLNNGTFGVAGIDISNLPYYTISAWVKATTSANLEVALGYGSNISNNPVVLIGKHTDNRAIFQHRDDTGNLMQIFSDNAINDTKWHLIMGVRYASNDHKMFVDGVIQTMTDTDTIGTTTENLAAIGMLPRATNSYFWNGSIDDVALYEDALHVGQVQQNYLAGLKKLLASNQISEQEYVSRLDVLNQYIAQN
ncbi:MAG: LamG-like jellyroll fold domain-containing protein [Candidatus Paceibacterota bacterium]|jgi:hypothetical protein